MADGIPRVVWTLWLQGWDAAPPLVQACLRSWQQRNPTWTVRPLTAENIREHLDLATIYPDVNLAGTPPVTVSDLVRIALLAEHGGVWADSTTFCVTPLDEWLHDHTTSGFFAFARPGPDRMLSNWFLASQPGHPLTVELRDRVQAYWRDRPAPDHYFWFHRLFGEAYRTAETVREVWDATPTIRSDGPHYFVPYSRRLAGRMSRRARARVLSGTDPVYKLSHRTRPSREDGRSAYDFFCRWADEPVDAAADGSAHAPRLLLATDRAGERVRWTFRHSVQGLRAVAGHVLRRTGLRRPAEAAAVAERQAPLSATD